MDQHLTQVETENSDCRELWTVQMPKQRFEDLIKDVTSQDVKDDNDHDSLELKNEVGRQARMYSLEQMH